MLPQHEGGLSPMPSYPTRHLAIGFAIPLVLALTAGGAAADTCTGLKLKALAKKAKGAAKDDPSLQAACDGKVAAKFSAAFGAAGTCGGVEFDCANGVDDCRDKVRAALPDAGKCEGARLKAAGKKAARKLGCYAKAALKSASVDTDCLAKAEAKFSAAFAKSGSCTGNEGA